MLLYSGRYKDKDTRMREKTVEEWLEPSSSPLRDTCFKYGTTLMGVPALQLTLFVVVGRTRTFPTKEATLSADMAFHIVWYCNLSDLQWYGNKDYMILRYFWSSVIVEKGHTQRASCLPVWLWMSCAFLFCEWDLTHCVDRWMIRWFGTITRTMELFIKMRQKKTKRRKDPSWFSGLLSMIMFPQ